MNIMKEDYNPDRTALDDRDKLIRKDERKKLLLEIFTKRVEIYVKSDTHEKAWNGETLYLISMYVNEFGSVKNDS